MWKVIYIAPSQHVAKQFIELLTAEGMLVTVRALGGGEVRSHGPVEIMVPQSEASEAHEILTGVICDQAMRSRRVFKT